ncbi:MAG: YIP1 family protein [Candidatus Krumholzibacteriia bacterium]
MTRTELRGLRPPPWEERDRYGFINALVLTIRLVLLEPGRPFRGMPLGLGVLQPVLFAAVLAVIGAVFDWMWSLALGSAPALLGPRLGNLLRSPWFGAGQFLLSPVLVVAMVFVRAGLIHLVLRVVGGARFGFEATLRVVAYSRATRLLSIIPFCGGVLGLIWELAVTIIGIARMHGCAEWKAIVAVAIPVLLGLAVWTSWLLAMAGLALVA